MTVKLSRVTGTPIKYPSLHSFVELSRDPGTITTVKYSLLRRTKDRADPVSNTASIRLAKISARKSE